MLEPYDNIVNYIGLGFDFLSRNFDSFPQHFIEDLCKY